MIERSAYQDSIELIMLAVGAVVLLLFFVWITTPPPVIIPEGSYLDPTGAVVPIPEGMMMFNGTLVEIPIPPPTPTPRQTPAALPTIQQKFVDPLIHGERYEGQWFRWFRPDILGLKDLNAGIIVYRHAFMDSYTWYNPILGQYFKQKPTEGTRYFAVWIHEEIFPPDDPGMYPFYGDSFRIQVGDLIIENDTVHNPVCRIREFDNKPDYYNIVTAPPLGWYIKKMGWNPETGGYAALRVGEIRVGEGNSVDGYLLFEVPKSTMIEDVMLLGNFGRFGTAYWRFE